MVIGACFFFWAVHKWEEKNSIDSANKQNTNSQSEDKALVDIQEMEEERLYGKKQTISLYNKNFFYRDDIKNYLIIGTDVSGNQDEKSDEYRGAMADFLMLLVVNYTEKTYSMLQINRDTMTKVTLLNQDGTGEATATLQICTAHWYGGTKKQSCKNTVQAVSNLLGGLKIDAYFALDMEAIRVLNHSVEGVTVTIKDDFTKVDSKMSLGKTMKLSDDQAYHYTKTRYGVGDESNASRMRRQQEYIQAYAKKAASNSGNEQFILSLYDQLQQYTTTTISGTDINKIVSTTQFFDNKGIYTIEGEEKIGQALGDAEDHVEYYLNEVSLLEVMQTLFHLQEQ